MRFAPRPGHIVGDIQVFLDEPDAHLNETKRLGVLTKAEITCAPGAGSPVIITSIQPGSEISWLRYAEQQIRVLLVLDHQGLPVTARGEVALNPNRQDGMVYVTVRRLVGLGFDQD